MAAAATLANAEVVQSSSLGGTFIICSSVASQRSTSVVADIEAGTHPYFPRFFPNLDRTPEESQPSGVGVVLVRVTGSDQFDHVVISQCYSLWAGRWASWTVVAHLLARSAQRP